MERPTPRVRLDDVSDATLADRSAIRAEAQLLAADEADREAMRIVREQLADLAPPIPD